MSSGLDDDPLFPTKDNARDLHYEGNRKNNQDVKTDKRTAY